MTKCLICGNGFTRINVHLRKTHYSNLKGEEMARRMTWARREMGLA